MDPLVSHQPCVHLLYQHKAARERERERERFASSVIDRSINDLNHLLILIILSPSPDSPRDSSSCHCLFGFEESVQILRLINNPESRKREKKRLVDRIETAAHLALRFQWEESIDQRSFQLRASVPNGFAVCSCVASLPRPHHAVVSPARGIRAASFLPPRICFVSLQLAISVPYLDLPQRSPPGAG